MVDDGVGLRPSQSDIIAPLVDDFLNEQQAVIRMARFYGCWHVAWVYMVQDALHEIQAFEFFMVTFCEHFGKQTRICPYFAHYLLYVAVVTREKIFGLVAIENCQVLFLDFPFVS